MPAVWTEDPTIGNALAGVANAAYMGPMTQLHATEIMQGIRQRNLEYQQLQERLRLQKQAGDQAAGIFGGGDTGMLGGNAGPIPSSPAIGSGAPATTSPVSSQDVSGGTSVSTGMGNIGAGQDQSSPSPDGSTQPIGASSQNVSTAATQAGMTPAAYRQKLASYYIPLMQLQAINGNTEGLQRTRDEAVAMLGENFGSKSLAEAFHFHQIYNDLKGAPANNFASQLENHVAGGNALTPSQALFMSRWAGAQSPLTYENLPTGERRPTRSGIPVSLGMLAELQRQGVAPAGFTTGGTQPGAPVPGGPAPQQLPPTGVVGPQPLAFDQKQAELTRSDPLYQNALEQTNLSKGILTALSEGNRASSLTALSSLIKTVIPNARAQAGSKEQLDDLYSKYLQMNEEFEKYLKSDQDLPDWLKLQIGQLAVDTASNAKNAYDSYYEPVRSAYKKRTGGDTDIAFPQIDTLNPNWKGPPGGGTTGEGALPSPGPQAVPGPAQAPGFKGRTATNPKTGQRMREIAPDQWEPM
jgi:hypothetical protein